MNLLRIALLQILPQGGLEKNRQKGVCACIEAKKASADIALFPEMWSNGYHVPEHPDRLRLESIPAAGEFVRTFGRLAAQLDMAIAITFLERYEPSARNTVERNLTPGEDFYVAQLDTAAGQVKVGAMICYDREFPESARILMLKGAEIILVPNACPMEINRLAQLRGRSFENMVGIATCNYPDGQPDCNGRSSAFDGVVYLPEMSGSRDICILQASGEEGIFLAEFDLDRMREYRKNEVHGNAYRHPKKYGLLTEERIEEPFIRSDYRA